LVTGLTFWHSDLREVEGDAHKLILRIKL
jgi:hypothetical protein